MFGVAAILAIASASSAIHARSVLPKAAKQAPYCDGGKGYCPISFGGFHMGCQLVPFHQAASECTSQGYQLAMVTDATVNDMIAVLTNCSSVPMHAWVQGVNGYVNDPCMGISNVGVVTGAVPDCFALGLAPFICQDIPAVTVTETSSTLTTTEFGVTTQVVPGYDAAHCSKLPSPPPPCQHCNEPQCQQQHHRHHKINQQLPVCPYVCPLEIGNLRLVSSNDVSSCEAYGWSFADLTTGETSAISSMLSSCAPSGSSTVWIKSYNGVTGTYCNTFNYNYGSTFVNFFMNSQECASAAVDFVLCVDQWMPPAVTASGPYSASVNYETVTVETTVVVTEPSSTRTITSYGPLPTYAQ